MTIHVSGKAATVLTPVTYLNQGGLKGGDKKGYSSMFFRGLPSGATWHSRGNIEIYIFLEKYLHDFRYKNMLRISIVFAFDFT
jgi:hypothetical protein